MKTSDASQYIVADAIVEELKKAGVEVAFGIVSIHNMPIYDAILRDGTIHLVAARGESGAVNMADGYARATGKLGVAITSTGAGAGNTAGSLTEAWNKGVPLLHIAGEVASSYVGTDKRYIHECKDQQLMMEGASKKSLLVRNPEQISSIMKDAISEARTIPKGPVTINIPIDLQSVIVPESTIVEHEEVVEEAPVKSVHLPDEMIEKIAKAKRPVIWAGGGVLEADARKELQILVETIGAAVVSGQSGKGALPENHPQCIGHFATYPPTRELFESSDLLISIGTRLRGNETANGTVPLPKEHISINLDVHMFNLNYPVTYGIVGDAKEVLAKINEKLAHQAVEKDEAFVEEVTGVRNEVREQLRKNIHPYDEFVDHMQDLMPKDTVFVRDITVPASLWGSRLYEIYEPKTNIYASGGGIGQGLPTAIGAQIGDRKRPVVLMAGDGGFMVNVGEMATAAQEKLPLVILLFDDKGYGVLRGIQDDVYQRQVAVDLFTPDFVKLGETMGFEAERVKSADEFKDALAAALKSDQPSIIVVDMNAVGPMAKRLPTGPDLMENYVPKKFD